MAEEGSRWLSLRAASQSLPLPPAVSVGRKRICVPRPAKGVLGEWGAGEGDGRFKQAYGQAGTSAYRPKVLFCGQHAVCQVPGFSAVLMVAGLGSQLHGGAMC